jgi:hypothetical protein
MNYTTGRKFCGEIKILSLMGKQRLASGLLLVIMLGSDACSVLQPPVASGPKSNVPAYPVLLLDEAARQQDASVAWHQLAQRYGLPDKTQVDLEPFTGTLRSLPANLSGPVFLPKVGAGSTQTEEETRESLRRFIADWRPLIGADPAQLSLIERTDEPTGAKVARYEQRPFRYPLRGGYGSLVIRFGSDRRVLELSSNCIPNADRLQAALTGITPRVTPEDALSHVKSGSITITDASGAPQKLSLSANETVSVRQLVVYALASKGQDHALELHLAWEIDLPNSSIKTIYLDAIEDRVIASS